MQSNDRPFTQVGRITSLFGSLFPPKKKQKPARYLTIRFKLEGVIPSKKNHWFADCNWRAIKGKVATSKSVAEAVDYLDEHLKWYIRNSTKYLEWKDRQMPVIHDQAKFWLKKYSRFKINYPLNNVTVKIYHYWADNQERDNTNKADTLNDLFVDAGIIVNDSWHNINQVTSESEYYGGQILDHLTTIDITIKLNDATGADDDLASSES